MFGVRWGHVADSFLRLGPVVIPYTRTLAKLSPIVFDPSRTVGLFRLGYGSTLTVAGELVRLVPANPNRVFLAIYPDIGLPGGVVYYCPGAGGQATQPRAAPAGTGVSLSWADLGAIVGYDWYVTSLVGGMTVHYSEVVFDVGVTPVSHSVQED